MVSSFSVILLLSLSQIAASPAPALIFEKNLGQTHPDVRYLSRSRTATSFLTDDAVVFSAKNEKIELRFIGTQPAEWRGLQPAGEVHSFTGARSKWRTAIPAFQRITRAGLYRGIDAVYYGQGRFFEVDYVIAPGADPGQIRFRMPRARLTAAGDLVAGSFRQRRPVAYQDGHAITASFRLDGEEIRIDVGAYDRRRELVIDPVIETSSIWGGSGDDSYVAGVNFIAGNTNSADFPGTTAEPAGNLDVFIAASDLRGAVTLIYFGGRGNDRVLAAKLLPAINRMVCVGETDSSDLPTGYLQGQFANTQSSSRTFQMQYGGGASDGFILSVGIGGNTTEVYASYWGGSGTDRLTAVADSSRIFAVGTTDSPGLAPATAVQSSAAGGTDAFILTTLPTLNSVVGTYWGGAGDDRGLGIAATGSDANEFLVTGDTASNDFPQLRPWQPALAGGRDAFVARWRYGIPSPNSIFTLLPIWSTYLGTEADDSLRSLRLGRNGTVLAAGKSGGDGWWTRIGLAGPDLLSQVRVGGSGEDELTGIGETAAGDVVVAGNTTSADLPVANAVQPQYGGGSSDGWVAYYLNDGKLGYLTYLGGGELDRINNLEVTNDGRATLLGETSSRNFPQVGGTPVSHQGGTDAFRTVIESGLLQVANVVVGQGLERAMNVTLRDQNDRYTATSADPARVLLGGFGGADGGSVTSGNAYAQALASEGEVGVRFAAAGYPERVATVRLVPAGVFVGSGSFSPFVREITADLGVDHPLIIASGALDPATKQVIEIQARRKGLPFEVNAISLNPEVGTIQRDSVGNLQFHPVAEGVAKIVLERQPAGFESPVMDDLTIKVAVTRRTFVPVTCGVIGKDLVARIQLNETSSNPANELATVTSGDPSRLTVSRTVEAAGSASVAVAGDLRSRVFYLQSLAAEGAVDVRVAAPGYEPLVFNCRLAPTAVIMSSSNPAVLQIGVNPSSVGASVGYQGDGFVGTSFDARLRPGVSIEVPYSVADTTVARTTLSSVRLEGGHAVALLPLEGLKVGETTVTLGTPSGLAEIPLRSRTVTVRVRENASSYVWTASPSLAKDFAIQAFLRIDGQPASKAPVTFRSSDPSRLLISTTESEVGAPEVTITPQEGFIYVYFQALSGEGSVQITAQAPGADPAIHTVQLLPVSLVYVTGGPVEGVTIQRQQNFRVGYRFGKGFASPPNAGQMVLRPGKSVRIRQVSSHPEVAAPAGPEVITFTGRSESTFPYQSKSPGETVFRLVSDDMVVGERGGQIRLVVSPPKLALPKTALFGKDTLNQVNLRMSVSSVSDWELPESTEITVTSSDPALLRVSASAASEGAASAVFRFGPRLPGATAYLEALSGEGHVTVTASAPSFTSAVIDVTLAPTGYVLNSNVVNGRPVSLGNFDSWSGNVALAILDSAGGFLASANRRPSLGVVNVPVTIEDPRIVGVDTPILRFAAGESSRSFTVRALTSGRTRVSIGTPPGFTTPSDSFRSFEFVVAAAGLQFDQAIAVRDLQTGVGLKSSISLPNEGVPYTVESSDPSVVLVSAAPNVAATASANGLLRNNGPVFWLQGVSSPGTATIRVRAEGYQEATLPVAVRAPSVMLFPNGGSEPVSLTSLLNARMDVGLGLVGADGYFSPYPLAPGRSLRLEAISDDSRVATVRNQPMVINALQSGASFEVAAAGTGETSIRLLRPEGYAASTREAVRVRVSLPELSISGLSNDRLTLGKDLQQPLTYYSTSSATPTVTARSLDSSKLTISGSASSPGQASATVSNGQFWLQALAGAGTVDVEVSAPGYASRRIVVQLAASGFALRSLSGDAIRTNTFTPALLRVFPVVLGLFSDNSGLSLRPGVAPALIQVTSLDPRVGAVAAVSFLPGSSGVQLQFQPLAVGATVLTLLTPAGYTETPLRTIPVTVTQAEFGISLPSFLGKDTVRAVAVNLPSAASTALTVRIASSDPARVLVARGPGESGAGVLELTLSANSLSTQFYLQGVTLGTASVTVTAPSVATYQQPIQVVATAWGFLVPGATVPRNTSVSFQIGLFMTDPTTQQTQSWPIRPNLTALPTAISSNTAVASPTGRNTSTSLEVRTGTSPGSAILTIQQPPGSAAYLPGASLRVDVN